MPIIKYIIRNKYGFFIISSLEIFAKINNYSFLSKEFKYLIQV